MAILGAGRPGPRRIRPRQVAVDRLPRHPGVAGQHDGDPVPLEEPRHRRLSPGRSRRRGGALYRSPWAIPCDGQRVRHGDHPHQPRRPRPPARRSDARAALYAEGLALRWDDGDKVSVAGCLRGLARTAVLARQYERGVRLFAAAEALREAIGAANHAVTRVPRLRLRPPAPPSARTPSPPPGRPDVPPASEAVAEALAVPSDAPDPTSACAAERHGLTARELEVLGLLAEGGPTRRLPERCSSAADGDHARTNILAKSRSATGPRPWTTRPALAPTALIGRDATVPAST